MAKLTITLEKIDRLAKYMRVGAPMKVVFDAALVPSSTYYRWMNIGQALADGDLEHPDIPKRPKHKANESDYKYNRRLRRYEEELELYVTCYETVEKAAALCKIEMLSVIKKAFKIDGQWLAARWFLERKDPRNWDMEQILRDRPAELEQDDIPIDHPLYLEIFQTFGRWDRAAMANSTYAES